MENKEKIINNLKKRIEKCRKCFLWKGTKNAAPGEGPTTAKVMFIGEAPGREEDIQGRPFVGRAGQLLTRLLEENKIYRKKVFITSVIKHRPPKNRKPKKPELLACEYWWQEQVKIIKPKLIVLLGKTAFDEIINQKKSFSKHRGKFLTIRHARSWQKYFISYHPAAGLRSTRAKKTLEKDFKKIKFS